jgi:hypothetical protein
MHHKLSGILHDLYDEFGFKTKIIAPVVGAWLYPRIVKEAKRLESGWTYEPATHYDKNAMALAEKNGSRFQS